MLAGRGLGEEGARGRVELGSLLVRGTTMNEKGTIRESEYEREVFFFVEGQLSSLIRCTGMLLLIFVLVDMRKAFLFVPEVSKKEYTYTVPSGEMPCSKQ